MTCWNGHEEGSRNKEYRNEVIGRIIRLAKESEENEA